MIEIALTAEDLANTRFAVDPVWEAVAALTVVNRPTAHPMGSRLRDLVPSTPDFDLDLLLQLTRWPNWLPDLLATTPGTPGTSPLERLAAVASTPLPLAAADQEELRRLDPDSRAAALTPEDLIRQVARALAGFWRSVMEGVWDRVFPVLSADIAERAKGLAGSGLRQTIDGLHPAVRCLSGSLEIAVDGDHTSAAGDHRGLWFVPSVFRWARVTAAVARGPVVVSYPARGFELVWEDAAGSRAAGLVPLLGRSRAAILEHLDVPRTTTNLSHRLGLAPGTVSTHLSVLTAAGLLHAWRDGRRVLYARNTLSTVLLGPS